MSHPATQISQPNQAIHIKSLKKIESLIISSSNPEHKQLLEGLKGIVYEIAKEASNNSKKTHTHLKNDDFSDLKNLSIYLQKIENFENHQNLEKLITQEKLANLLKIKKFTKSSYGYEILNKIKNKASFSAFAHLDKILQKFPKRPVKILFKTYIVEKIDGETLIDGETFKTWNRAFSTRELAPLFCIGKDTLYSFIKNNSNYNKAYSAPIKELPDNQISLGQSSSNPGHKQLLECLKDIVSEIAKEASNKSENTHTYLKDDDFSDLKNLSIYLQKIESFENHKNLLQSYSLEKLASFLNIKNFTNKSYSYKILNELEATASFSAFAHLDTILREFAKIPGKRLCLASITTTINDKILSEWNKYFSIEDLAPLFNMNMSSLYKFRENLKNSNDQKISSQPAQSTEFKNIIFPQSLLGQYPTGQLPDNEILPVPQSLSSQALPIKRLAPQYDHQNMYDEPFKSELNTFIKETENYLEFFDSLSFEKKDNHFDTLSSVNPHLNLKNETKQPKPKPISDLSLFSKKRFLDERVSENTFGHQYSKNLKTLNKQRFFDELASPGKDFEKLQDFVERKHLHKGE